MFIQSSSSSRSSSTESLDQLKTDSSSNEEKPTSADPDSVKFKSVEEKIYDAIIRHLLPKIGAFVSTLILSASSSITNRYIREMLKLLPTVRHVDLSFTNVSAEAVFGLARFGALRNLEELNVSGCLHVNDQFLFYLAKCYMPIQTGGSGVCLKSRLRKLNLSGCKSVSSVGVEWLQIHEASIQELDLVELMIFLKPIHSR